MSRPFSDFAFDWKPGWKTRASNRPQDDDSRFSDEDIMTILHAGEAGMKVEALCTASDIPVETYYVWKAKYGGLTPTELRARRLKERRKGRTLAVSATAATAVLVAVGVGYAFVAPMRGEPTLAQSTALARRKTAPPRPKPMNAEAGAAQRATAPPTGAAVAATATAPTAPTLPATTAPRAKTPGIPAESTAPPNGAISTKAPRVIDAAEIESADPSGPSVQVAAVPRLDDARVAMERLASLGYPVHMTTKVVDGAEMYRVRVGPLKSRAVAEEVARQLEGAGFTAPWITK